MTAITRSRSAPSRLALWYIRTYRERVAPRFAGVGKCRFEPGCSAYGQACYERYGFLRATAKTVWRIMRCHPFRRGMGIVDPP